MIKTSPLFSNYFLINAVDVLFIHFTKICLLFFFQIVLFLHQTLKKLPQTRPSDNYDKRALDLVEQIKKKLYKNSIIQTFWDFVIFFNEYFPSELSQKALPSAEFTEKGTRNIGPPMTQKTIFEPLNKYYDNSDDSDDSDFLD